VGRRTCRLHWDGYTRVVAWVFADLVPSTADAVRPQEVNGVDTVEQIVRVLQEPSWSFSDGPSEAMQSPGLYAMHIEDTAWMELGLDVRDR
jgi:hypothetical protein